MSDIYEYVYDHIASHQESDEEEDYIYPVMQEETLCAEAVGIGAVNTEDFSPKDLQMFVDSLETIARLEQAKREKKQKGQKAENSSNKRQVTCLDSSTCSSIHEDDLQSFSESSDAEDLYDEEDYFGLPVQGQSTALYSNLNTCNSINSDSEDSGVYVIKPKTPDHLYENLPALRPRSKMVSYAKNKSLKSRLLALIMKKQYVKPQHPSEDVLSSTTIGEQTHEEEIYERVIDEVLQHQLTEKTKKPKKKFSTFKPEHKFLEKAMRLLTL